MIEFLYPPKPRPGDRVAILSPSSGLPGLFPLPHELGLRRLRDDFGLEPVEYPTTRKMGATAEERAADVHAAFADPGIKAVIATIGGDDQITVLPHLDGDLLRANPKPFIGYSDNTNLLLFLRNLGIVGYHGASVMVELGRPGAMHPATAASLRAALFTSGAYELNRSGEYGDENLPWEDPRTFESEPVMERSYGWTWHNDDRVVEGAGWGGNLEILAWLMAADRAVLPAESYAGDVLFLETSEEMPRAEEVYRMLRNMGERGLLRQFPALLMGRAKSWSFENPFDAGRKERYREEQREAVLRALRQYAPDTMAVFDVDLGHTDPQLVIPVGGRIRVDGPARRITVTY
ncbi:MULTISPECIES: S66 family peptidase [Streptomyces]|uniref:LD-carboxypeptidase n=1 Tax=Streptomyces virginiae TaxID=1961 RepID=A0ABQ3NFW3_STRVG|nr:MULTISPECIES: S66 peptidase family protein [Streptomyces]KOU13097.1 peptidase [Streptomyces sp. WM6349]KOU80903.1 peptidase [Streptomyces sp. XY593]KOU91906.1 peptidase [Streptomyces sp. XY533]KOV39542.1 peptidase [Streptomyces sp. H036]MBP2346907.1 muramoyltetrapeptide carboxypeptidase LdcA involved in peptidoglycan recycling [Streptomyces virginiae]